MDRLEVYGATTLVATEAVRAVRATAIAAVEASLAVLLAV